MSIIVVTVDTSSLVAAGPPRKDKFGRSTSLKWPWLFDILKSKGLDPSAAAAISNANVKFRKKGRKNVLTAKQAENPAVLKRIGQAQKLGVKPTAKNLTKGFKRKV